MKIETFIDAISYAVQSNATEYPSNYIDIVNRLHYDELSWDEARWDSDTAKPSWDDIDNWAFEVKIRRMIYPQNDAWEVSVLKGHRKELIKQLNRNELGIHLGDSAGVSNLALMLSTDSKIDVQLRKTDGTIFEVKTKGELQAILAIVARNENIVHNAHNAIRSDYTNAITAAKNTELDKSDRLTAASKAGAINKNYASLLRSKVG